MICVGSTCLQGPPSSEIPPILPEQVETFLCPS